MKLNELITFWAELVVKEYEPEVYSIYFPSINTREKELCLLKELITNSIMNRFPNLRAQVMEAILNTVKEYESDVYQIYNQFYIQGGELSVRELQKQELQKLVQRILRELFQ